MFMRRWHWLLLLLACAPAVIFAGTQKPCVTADEASKLINKDVCVSAHVYDVVELPDGTRFLDICTPETPDEKCEFTIVSLSKDRDTVGELHKYRDMDVHVRGIVRPMHGRAGMVLSMRGSSMAGRRSSDPTRNWRAGLAPIKAYLQLAIPTSALKAEAAPL